MKSTPQRSLASGMPSPRVFTKADSGVLLPPTCLSPSPSEKSRISLTSLDEQTFADAAAVAAAHDISNESLLKIPNEIKVALQEHERILENFIRQELQFLKDSLLSEFRGAKEDILDHHQTNHDSIRETLEGNFSKLARITAEEGESEEQVAEKLAFPRAFLTDKSLAPTDWNKFVERVNVNDTKNVYSAMIAKKSRNTSVWHELLEYFGFEGLLHEKPPQNCFVPVVEHSLFVTVQTLVIALNTVLMGYETDAQIKAVLKNEELPTWIDNAETCFNVAFSVELIVRICAYRSWFIVAPGEWGWNVFDTFLVVVSALTDLFNTINLSFMRTFRILRVARIARLVRIFRFFKDLRQFLFSIMACMNSLSWAFVFMFLTMFMCAILFVQAVVKDLQDMDKSTADYDEVRADTEQWYPALSTAMVSLLASVTGGVDWLEVRKPLKHAGPLYDCAFVLYVLFFTVGVMNVLTGVFLSSADDFTDLSLLVQNEQIKVEKFVEQILELFKVIDISKTGEVEWASFKAMLEDDRVWSFFASKSISPTHLHLAYDLLDEGGVGKLHIQDFVFGLVRLMGEAKAIDARVIQRELAMLPLVLRYGIQTAEQLSRSVANGATHLQEVDVQQKRQPDKVSVDTESVPETESNHV